MSIIKDLNELIEAEVIDAGTASKIKDYYKSNKSDSSSRLFLVFGVLGALLVGLGIILIIAHNWDNLSRGFKTFLSLIPLLIGQAACLFTILKKKDSPAWREASSIFLFLAIGASISLISQIYNIPGNIATFTVTWMLLALPLVYLMPSSSASLMYLMGITYYACELGYWGYPDEMPYLYILLFVLVFPHYYLLFKNKSKSNFFYYLNWFVPLSLAICLGAFVKHFEELLLPLYLLFFAILTLIGGFKTISINGIKTNGYRVIGRLGTIGMLLAMTFNDAWSDLSLGNVDLGAQAVTLEFALTVAFGIIALLLLIAYVKREDDVKLDLLSYVFIPFMLIYVYGHFETIVPAILTNILLLLVAIATIYKGTKEDSLGILNFGMLIIMALVVARFFDTDISFVLRGILFISVGVGFFVANYLMLKKRREIEAA